jgi:hypothetical protein
MLGLSCRRSEAPAPGPPVVASPRAKIDFGAPQGTRDAAGGADAAEGADAAGAAPTDPAEELTARTYDVLLRDAIVYRATTAGVVVEDITQPQQPRRLATAALPSSVTSLAWIGRIETAPATACPILPDGGSGCPPPAPREFVAAAIGPEGVAFIDVTDPAHPFQAARFDTSGSAMRLALASPRLFVADGVAGVLAIDVADPADPRPAGAWSPEPVPPSAAATPACPGDGDGEETDCAVRTVGDPPPYARDVVLAAGLLWVALGPRGIVGLEVRAPRPPAAAPEFVPRVTLATPGEARALAFAGATGYVAAGPAGLRVVDVDLGGPDPEPGELGGYATRDMCRDVKVSGSHAYLAVGDRGLEIVDVSDPAAPRLVGSHVTRRPVNRVTLGPSGLLLLANDAAGMMIVDVADPAAIRQVFPIP